MTALVSQAAEKHNVHLTKGHVLARNVAWNLLGNSAPMVVAIFSIPLLIRGLGTDRFGVLTLVWAVIGYATLFDLGLGRALTQVVARKLGAGEDHEVPAYAWTSLLLMLALGLIGAAAVILLAPWLVHRGLHVPGVLERETLRSFYLLGLSIPVVISTAGLRGLLEAQQRFGIVNAIRIPMGVFTFAGPLLVLPFSKSLFPVVAVLVTGRFAAWVAHLVLCLRVTPALGQRVIWQHSAMGSLLRFGSWMTVSNVAGPLMVTLDRFVIGALLSMAAVAYYATPYEAVTKLWLIPGALISVMFPAFSTSFAQDRDRTASLYRRSVKYLLLSLFPLVLFVVVLAQDGLKFWLGAEFARNSAHVLQWLAVGVFLNSLAMVPSAFLPGVGRPDLTAKLYLIELPLYLAGLWWLTKAYGIEGTAMAWTARASVDALALFGMARRLLPAGRYVKPQTIALVALAFLVLTMATLPQGLVLKAIFLLVTILGFAAVTWFLLLSRDERNLAQKFL